MKSKLRGARPNPHSGAKGFTLVEMAVVVVIMALILGSILVPLSTQVEQRQIIDTQRQLEQIKEALIGHALAQTPPYLPCPDKTSQILDPTRKSNDGKEDRLDNGVCEVLEGNIPWATLGLGGADPWDNRYRYRVTKKFADAIPGITLADRGKLLVCNAISSTLTSCSTPPPALTVQPGEDGSPVALVLSHGPNGWGGFKASRSLIGQNAIPNTKPAGLSALSNDENANADGAPLLETGASATYVSRTRAGDTGANPSTEFDDILVWLSPYTLKNRLVTAGKLP